MSQETMSSLVLYQVNKHLSHSMLRIESCTYKNIFCCWGSSSWFTRWTSWTWPISLPHFFSLYLGLFHGPGFTVFPCLSLNICHESSVWLVYSWLFYSGVVVIISTRSSWLLVNWPLTSSSSDTSSSLSRCTRYVVFISWVRHLGHRSRSVGIFSQKLLNNLKCGKPSSLWQDRSLFQAASGSEI